MVESAAMGVNEGAVIFKLVVATDVTAVSDICGPIMQLSQYQGLLRQFAVVFFLSVHFLWKIFLHLIQASS